MQNVQVKKPTDNEQLTIDIMRGVFASAVAKFCLDVVLAHDKLPEEMNRNVIKETAGQLARYEREVRRATHGKHHKIYLDKNLKSEKLLDMCTVLDTMARVGAEEHTDTYQEFLGLVVDLVDRVFYAQKNRKNIHFGKYKALFKLISEEIRRDVNHEPNQLLFTNKGELYFRVVPPPVETQIK